MLQAAAYILPIVYCTYEVQEYIFQDTEPQTVPDVLLGTSHGSYRHQCKFELL